MSLNADQPINRAMVAGCAIYATGNYLKLHMPRTLNPLLCNLHAKTRKLWKHSVMRAFRPHTVHWSASSPLDALRVPADMPTAPLGSPAGRHPRCLVLVSSFPSKAAQHAILIEFCCRLVRHFPRLRALALFSRRPPHRVVRPSFRRPKTLYERDLVTVGAGCRSRELVGCSCAGCCAYANGRSDHISRQALLNAPRLADRGRGLSMRN